MEKKDFGAMKSKTIKQLEKQVAKERADLLKFATEFKAGKKKSPKKGRALKKSIAQILTVIREKEIVEQSERSKKTKETK